MPIAGPLTPPAFSFFFSFPCPCKLGCMLGRCHRRRDGPREENHQSYMSTSTQRRNTLPPPPTTQANKKLSVRVCCRPICSGRRQSVPLGIYMGASSQPGFYRRNVTHRNLFFRHVYRRFQEGSSVLVRIFSVTRACSCFAQEKQRAREIAEMARQRSLEAELLEKQEKDKAQKRLQKIRDFKEKKVHRKYRQQYWRENGVAVS